MKVRVPPSVQASAKLPAWLKEALPTDSPRAAETLKWTVIARLKQRIEDARNGVVSGTEADPIVAEALLWKEAIADDTATGEPSDTTARMALEDRVDAVADRLGHERAQLLAGIALGTATPLDSHVEAWIKEKAYKGRTEAARRHAIRIFRTWCVDKKVPVTIEAVTRKLAGRFVTEHFVSGGIHAATANKAISGLSSYWEWLAKRGHIEDDANPWHRQFLKVGTGPKGEDGQGIKRPFTDTEVAKLIAGITKQPLADMCRLAALSGARITELAELRVRHLTFNEGEDGTDLSTFRIVDGKTDSAARTVPIHSSTFEMLKARCEGKAASDFVFHELPEQSHAARKRSAPASQAFVRERRELGVDDQMPGVRQSRVDFHSWRRWFIRKAVEALENGAQGFTAWTIADVVGHSKEDGPLPMTMGRYPGVAGTDALRACVESVRFPEAKKRDANA
ncbi:tyrosine-type recombinase/integrase [Ancylobacter oerskovii]|uniref:Tyrosine-type recombinase/integrase n=1 Tax=Ancylobacter oerskovii TaxID=459519 RepID=A0ABW4YZX1_9HYPH|nr:hypothetical protein [Ancylobacter oerskovii]MBS7544023.1 hypothetical protein [Ancylobacter oerskovii]